VRASSRSISAASVIGGTAISHSNTDSIRILVVDDHEISRRYTVSALRQNGRTVKQAGNAEEALGLALEWLPDVLFVDLALGDADGRDLIRDIGRRWAADRPPPRIVIFSADPAPCLRRPDGLPANLLVLTKPSSIAEIRAAADGQAAPTNRAARAGAGEALLSAFRSEMALRLREIDDHLLRADLKAAAAILHQLIASSAICGESGLERNLRALEHACRVAADPATLARSYLDLAAEWRDYLQSDAAAATVSPDRRVPGSR
jgi:CheY-like chemotaxis protein